MRASWLAAWWVCRLIAAGAEMPLPPGLNPAGAALAGDTLAVWGGGGAALLDLPSGNWQRLSAQPYGEGGAAGDLDGDGRLDLVLASSRGLVWLQAPNWRERMIDPGAEAGDVLVATLDGRRGVVTVHRGGQVRFYQAPPSPDEAWPARDLYSFYSVSEQGGLLALDVDRDGREDLVCGNYWMRSPAESAESWRLFAIKLWSEQRRSGLTAWAALPGGHLAASQRAMRPARLAWYRRPADPRQLWREHVLDVGLDQPATLLAEPGAGLVVAERGSRGRVLVYPADGDGLQNGRAWLAAAAR